MTVRMTSSFEKVLSVTTSTFFAPSFPKSIPASAVQPGPEMTPDAAISKAYSFSWLYFSGLVRPRSPDLRARRVVLDGSGLGWHGQSGGRVCRRVRGSLLVRRAAAGRTWTACVIVASAFDGGSAQSTRHRGHPCSNRPRAAPSELYLTYREPLNARYLVAGRAAGRGGVAGVMAGLVLVSQPQPRSHGGKAVSANNS